MAVKLSNTSGTVATISTLDPGDIGINLPDGRMFVTDGITVSEIGANLSGNSTIGGNITVGNSSVNTFITSSNLTTTDILAETLEITDVATINTNTITIGSSPVNTIISAGVLDIGGNINANGSVGTAGQVLKSGGSGANSYWSEFNTGPAFSAYADSSTQTITSGSQQKVLFQVEEYDTNSNFASSRFTPTTAGYYQLNAEVRFDGSTGTGETMIVIWKNGSEHKRGWNASGTEWASSFWAMTVSTLVYANGTGDYFEVYVQQTSGSSRNITAVNSPNITWFNGAMVRGA